MILLVQLVLAHLLGDFCFQPAKWVRHKEKRKLKSAYLYLHALIHFALILGIVGRWDFWKPALLIATLHLVLDGTKLLAQKSHTERSWFFTDQGLHLVALLAVWAWVQHIAVNWHAFSDKTVLIPVTAVLFVLNPSSYLIKNTVSRWAPPSSAAGSQSGLPAQGMDSLSNAGNLIGMLERVMILAFIFLGKWEGVGFLLAAKSVFRFGDLKDARDRKLSEYVLIGTFLSFAMAILSGQLAVYLLAR